MVGSDPAWQVIAVLQTESDPQSIDRSLARDEALDVVLGETIAQSAPDLDLARKRYHSLCRNRLSKHTHRRMLERNEFRPSRRRGGSEFGSVLLMPPARSILDELAYRQLTNLLRRVLPDEEFRILLEIADGYSYSEMAKDRNMTVPSLKSKAFRARQKVRNSCIATSLRHGLRR